MRISLMEFGRFTASQIQQNKECPRRGPADNLIMLHDEGEGNHQKVHGFNAVVCTRNGYGLAYSFGRSRRRGSLRLFGDDLVLNFLVGGLRNNFLVHQVELGPIRPSRDDFLRISVADAR
jgi:hypothetical protein